jgi:hypothetical protein
MEVGGLTLRTGRFTSEETRYPLYMRLGGPRSRSGRVRKLRLHQDSIPGPSIPWFFFRGYEVFVHFQQWGTGSLAALFNSILIWLPEPSGSQSGDLGEKLPLNFLHAVNLRHVTDGFTSPPKEVVLRIFITLKNPSTSVRIEPANLGFSGEHANH